MKAKPFIAIAQNSQNNHLKLRRRELSNHENYQPRSFQHLVDNRRQLQSPLKA